MIEDLRKKSKSDFENDFFKLTKKPGSFGKTIENVKEHRDIQLITTEARRNYLVSKPNYDTTNFFVWKFISNRNKKSKYTHEQPVYLGMIM